MKGLKSIWNLLHQKIAKHIDLIFSFYFRKKFKIYKKGKARIK